MHALIRHAITALIFLCLAAAAPRAALAHISLTAATPAPGDTITAPPGELRLRFSAFIEGRYTGVTLIAPDGRRVATGPITFVADSDRELTLQLPALVLPGEYTVQWRTAGADGHVLEGSYTFVLLADTSFIPDTAADTTAAAVTPDAHADTDAHADEHAHGTSPTSSGILPVGARLLHFLALTLLLGAVALRVFVLPRLALGHAAFAAGARALWRAIAIAAVLLAIAAVLRLWLQSSALHGAERATSIPLISIMLTDTSWGRAWVLQAFLFAVLGMAIAWARPGRDRTAVFIAIPAAAGLAAIPGLSGHAAGVGRLAFLVVANDALHVTAAGAWVGSLAVLMVWALPSLRRSDPGRAGLAAAAVQAFSPVALAAAGTVLVTGVINALMHIPALELLWTSGYGRALLLKIALVAGVLAAGFLNWRFVTPHLMRTDDVRRLRISAAVELTFAALVLVVTAVLTGLARP